MTSNQSFISLFCLISFVIPLPFYVNSSHDHLCHDDERSALLQFKKSFVIDFQVSRDPFAYPKVESWKLKRIHNDTDCCKWNGIICDDKTGHVIGLDLSSSCLYGSINATSSLFLLVHLHTLNLADNDFNHSQIPSEIGHLYKLTYLNLSSSSFVGQIPSTITKLTNLSILDLASPLQFTLTIPDFGSLIKNLTKLEDLRLWNVNLSSTVPRILANFTSLKALSLSYCGLYGEFPVEIFYLPNLQTLKLVGNPNLVGQLAEFNSSSPLQELMLRGTSFSGELPTSIGNLGSLKSLEISGCIFFGKLPASLGNATKLEIMDLARNNFEVTNPSSLSWIGKLTRLRFLSLHGISFNNKFPSFFSNLTQLKTLSLDNCQIRREIPSWIMNMTQLEILMVPANQLQGLIPDSIFQLRNLRFLDLSRNNLSGTVDLSPFLSKFRNLNDLYLSDNNLLLVDNANTSNANASIGKFSGLGFKSCNLSHFPHFLRNQDDLNWLDLSGNHIHGQIPIWLWNTSIGLENVDLSDNFLTGFEQDPKAIPWSQVTYLDLSYNMMQGSLPLLPLSIQMFMVGSNNLSGEISPVICNCNVLYVLDLSYNNFSGILPQCLGNFSTFIQLLRLGGNHFHGKFPHNHIEGCNLRMLDAESNELEGELPRSLVNCTKLEVLSFGSNKINDVFPSWLGAHEDLKILILRSNEFHGSLENHKTDVRFPKLCIIDLSHNNFSGKLPTQYFLNWKAMKMVAADRLVYLGISVPSEVLQTSISTPTFLFTMSLTNKGTQLDYNRILDSFVAIDFSSNKFEGHIPKVIGNLIGLRLLNLSNNNFNGGIPTSLGNLTNLESLDLSRNNLMKEIPHELTQLVFLSVFNVSCNNLVGPIPHGKQFDTFDNSSYQNNSNLCGNPLSKKCEESEILPASGNEEDHEKGSIFEFSWVPVLIGYGSGLIIGGTIGHIVVTRKYEWFSKILRIRSRRIAQGTKRTT